MRFNEPILLGDIADKVGATVQGDRNQWVNGINEIHKVGPGDLTYVDVDKYYNFVLNSSASFVIIDKYIDHPEDKTLLLTEDPFTAYNELAKEFRPFESCNSTISASAQIGHGTVIQPNVFIGNHVTIGKNCIIHPGVVIYDHSIIGDNVIIQANSVIGGDAFYYKQRTANLTKMHTVGRAIIEDDVEVGSGCMIDAGVSGDTIIGQGSKLDNLIHIGHGVVVGKHNLMCAGVMIAGKTITGDGVTLYGKVGVNKCLNIGDNVTVLGASNVGSDLEAGKTYFGTPAVEARQKWKELAMLRKLPDILEKLMVK